MKGSRKAIRRIPNVSQEETAALVLSVHNGLFPCAEASGTTGY
jgi:hypothetical protein